MRVRIDFNILEGDIWGLEILILLGDIVKFKGRKGKTKSLAKQVSQIHKESNPMRRVTEKMALLARITI